MFFALLALLFALSQAEQCNLPLLSGRPVGGHTQECFSNKILSYDLCIHLFLQSSCAAVSFQDMLCSLHDTSYRVQPDAGALAFSRPTCEYTSPRQSLMQCLRHNTIPDISSLPELAIVVSITRDFLESREGLVQSVTSNMKCYAAVHKYQFHLNVLEPMPAGQFFFERHFSVLEQYLPRYQHVLHLDADSLFLNLSQPMTKYLHRHAVSLHLNPNGEVSAAAYLLRNVPSAYCFMRYWLSMRPRHYYEVVNYDNGDLVSAVSRLIAPLEFPACVQSSLSRYSVTSGDRARYNIVYHESIVKCFQRLQPTLLRRVRTHAPFLRIFHHHEGFWRMKSRMGRFGVWWDNLFGKCYSSDIVGHGWQAMPRELWRNNSCDIPAIRESHGANAVCEWHTLEQEVSMQREYCAWRSPACIDKSCIRPASMCHKLYHHIEYQDMKNLDIPFDISNEVWWKQQICSACPLGIAKLEYSNY